MRPEDPRHGTIAGYNAHHRDGETACQPCRDAKSAYRNPFEFTEDEVALTDGEWRIDLRTRVLRWVPNEPALPPIVHITAPVVCLTCDAGRTEGCRTTSGERTKDHAGRIRPRECECGTTDLKPGARWCEPCVKERRRQHKRARRTEEAA